MTGLPSLGICPQDFYGWLGAVLDATVQHHERVSYHISLAQEKIKFKIQSTVSTECASYLHHSKDEKH